MKNKLNKIMKNESSIFWSAAVVALMAIVKAISNLSGITLAPDFIDNLMGVFMAIIAFLVALGILTKNNKSPEEEE